ncbi:MAG: leucine-rich repeat protein [Oscillospiraceae bacterium]|nr:leucine-rich repeat protein [Oscillospiraceae bacterium]MCL2125397.1 leucine-rich repeat protein [Oscillospiraceae bacterium]
MAREVGMITNNSAQEISAAKKLLIKLHLSKPPPDDKQLTPWNLRQKALAMRAAKQQSSFYAQRVGYLILDLQEMWENDIQTSLIESYEETKTAMEEFTNVVDDFASLLEAAAQELSGKTVEKDKASIFATDDFGPITITLSDIPYLKHSRIRMKAPDQYYLMTQEGVSTEVLESRKSSEYLYNIYSDHVELVKYIGYKKEVDIPAELDGLPVTHIGMNCFALAWDIRISDVKIPETVTTIYHCAFRGCRVIKTLDLPSSLKYIGNYAFGFLTSLEALHIPENVVALGYGAFRNCTNLFSVTIPDSTIKIGSDCFYRCKELRTVEISNSVIDIEGWAFRLCDNLESVTIGSNVVNIGDSVFYDCICLKSVDVPDSVEQIGDTAFYSRRGITLECSEGSYAEQYAKDNRLKYIVS